MKIEQIRTYWFVRFLKSVLTTLKSVPKRSKEAMMFVDEVPNEFRDKAKLRSGKKQLAQVGTVRIEVD